MSNFAFVPAAFDNIAESVRTAEANCRLPVVLQQEQRHSPEKECHFTCPFLVF